MPAGAWHLPQTNIVVFFSRLHHVNPVRTMINESKNLISREVSWLYFNERVLQEAMDPQVPIIERIRFLGIYSNNLDEFYRVRVATLKRMSNVPKRSRRDLFFDPKAVLKEIARLDTVLQARFVEIYQQLKQELQQHQIYMVDEQHMDEQHASFVKAYFEKHVRPHLFPIMLTNFKTTANLKDKSVYLAVDIRSRALRNKQQYALIQVPTDALSRFLILPPIGDKRYIIMLDDVIRFCLDDIFSIYGYDTYDAYTIKFTRDAELDIDNDVSRSFLESISLSLKQRKKGQPVRFIIDRDMPEDFFKVIAKKFQISGEDTIARRGRYHNFKDFMSFPNVGSKELEYEPTPPLPHPLLPPHQSILNIIRERDVMLHYPYQSFQYVIELLREASIDPRVRAIKMTLYRVARDSNIIKALINAARNGKEVIVFLELQARFDEEANIYWAGKMQEEGVKIIQTIPGYKVHAKLLLIRRKESNKNVYYANISTGNFHEGTARVYADDSLMTADPLITSDVNKVFHLLEEKFNRPDFSRLIVAPFDMRNHFVKLIRAEARNARKGLEAWAIIKLNNLVDNIIIDELYKASKAGVRIRLIVRGVCKLIPGIPGVSDNIEAISIVDKFLEHSRVFVFCNKGKEEMYISSADWMLRNFDHRIEVACPILDPELRNEIRQMLEIQWKDNTKARLLTVNPMNTYRLAPPPDVRSQIETYAMFRNLLEQ